MRLRRVGFDGRGADAAELLGWCHLWDYCGRRCPCAACLVSPAAHSPALVRLPPLLQGQGGDKPTRKMFVGGLSDISDAEFRAHFVPFGNIVVRGCAALFNLGLQPAECHCGS